MKMGEFVAIWNEAASLEEFLKTTGYAYGTAVQSASRYRRRGEWLKYWNEPKPNPEPEAAKPVTVTDTETIAAMFRSEDAARFRRF